MWKFDNYITFWTILLRLFVIGFSRAHEIPEDIYEFCPYTDICNKTAKRTLDEEGLRPCCKPCGCDKECGLRLDCCFDYLDTYKLIENNLVACVRPLVGDELVLFNHGDEYYYMVKSCADMTYDDNGSILVEPVSSVATGNIYINAAYAHCNNVHTFTAWNFIYFSALRAGIGGFVWSLEQNKRNALGAKVYVPPPDEDWSRKRCYNIIYDECPDDIYVDEKTILASKCRHINVFYLSFVNPSVTYKNIFCYKCNTKYTNIETECTLHSRKSFHGKQLTVLLKASFFERQISLKTVSEHSVDHCPSGFVLSHSQESCLPVLCPEGMLQTADGCKYFILRWFTPSCFIQIKLVSSQGKKLTVSELMSLDATTRAKPFAWIKSHCSKIKPIRTYVYYPTNDRRYVQSLVVQLWLLAESDGGIDLSVLLPKLQKCLDGRWRLHIQGKIFDYIASLDNYFIPEITVKFNLTLRPPFTRDENESTPQILFDLISDGPQHITLTFSEFLASVIGHSTLKKTFFCRQVQISTEEVLIKAGEILLLANNRTLGNNEYTINKKDGVNTGRTVSICLEDYKITERACACCFSNVRLILLSLLFVWNYNWCV